MSSITNKSVLAIETSLGRCSVALSHGDDISFMESEKTGMQSELLFPMIQGILDKRSIKISDLDAIACTIGPGSFTGVRIGIAAARGIRHVFKGMKLLGISTLELLAYSVKGHIGDTPVVVLIESRKGEFYMQKFNSELESLQEIQIVYIEDVCIGEFIVSNVVLGKGELVSMPNAKLLLSRAIDLFAKGVEHKNIYPLYIKDPNIT